jgi:Domain of unknown function (DUF4936)
VPPSYYIYYRVDPARADAARERIDRLLDDIRAATGIAGRLLKKRGEPLLWMEVYGDVADEARFERELAAVVTRLDAAGILQPGGGRHIECFES